MMKRNRMGAAVALVASTCLVASCAELDVHRATAADKHGPVQGKLTYFLPRTALSVTLTANISQCAFSKDKVAEIKGTVTASVTPNLEADPSQEYWIDYDSSRTWLKQINLSVNTSGKMIQSFNGTINDQAGPTAVAAVTTVVQIASAVVLGMADFKAELKQPNLCNSDVRTALRDVDRLNTDIRNLNTRIEQFHKKIASDNAVPGKDDPTLIWTAAISADQTQLAADKAVLTTSRTYIWRPEPTLPNPNPPPGAVQNSILTKTLPISELFFGFLDKDGQDWFKDQPKASEESTWEKVHAPLVLVLKLDPDAILDPQRSSPYLLDAVQKDPIDGLVIRDSVNGFVQPCTVKLEKPSALKFDSSKKVWVFADEKAVTSQCEKDFDNENPDKAVTFADTSRVPVNMPQFGRFIVYNLHNEMFEDDNLVLTLNPDSSIASVSFGDSSTAAAGITGIGSAATAASTGISSYSSAVTAASTQSSTNAQTPDAINKALADCVSQAQSVQNAGLKPVPCQ